MADVYATIAYGPQDAFCGDRDCDYRSARLHAPMELEDIRDWADAKRGRRRQLAEAIGIDQDKVSKSLGKQGRRFTSAEMDIARRVVRDDQGEAEQEVATIPFLGSVPAGSLKEAFRNPAGRIPVPDASVPKNAYALEPDGDSMDLVVTPGSKIILDPDDVDLHPDRYYVVQADDGEVTFKQYQERPARLKPCSSNPSHQEILLGSGIGYRVLARVIGSYSRM